MPVPELIQSGWRDRPTTIAQQLIPVKSAFFDALGARCRARITTGWWWVLTPRRPSRFNGGGGTLLSPGRVQTPAWRSDRRTRDEIATSPHRPTSSRNDAATRRRRVSARNDVYTVCAGQSRFSTARLADGIVTRLCRGSQPVEEIAERRCVTAAAHLLILARCFTVWLSLSQLASRPTRR